MSVRRVGGLVAMALGTLLWASCGQIYRPVVIPCTGANGIPGCPVEPPPTPANFHTVFSISNNILSAPGAAMQIDVSGDSIIAETPSSDPKFGANPTNAALLANNARLFVASAASVDGGLDVISSVTPAFQSTVAGGFGPVGTVALPAQSSAITAISESGNTVTVTLATPLSNIPPGYTIAIQGVAIPSCSPPACNQNAYDGGFPLTMVSGSTLQYTNSSTGLPTLTSGLGGATATFPPQPVFLNTTQSTAIFSANFNTNSVFAINTTSDVVSNTAPVGTNPVSLAETPNAFKIYVANQGSNSVSSLNVSDLSPNPVSGFTGTAPVWAVARGDSQKVYVLTQGDSELVTIDVATDTVTSSLPVGGPGANFIYYDPHLNRLYVTNPVAGMVYVFSDTGGVVNGVPSDIPVQLAQISFNSGSPQCPTGCVPASVTALADGSRFYVASYQAYAAGACPDPVIGTASACVVPSLTVFDALAFAPKITPALTLLTWSPSATTPGTFATNQFAVQPLAACAPAVYPALYSPSTTRFRVFTASSVDSSRVYVSMCDAGAVAVINTTDSNTNNTDGNGYPADTLITDLPAPFGNCSQASCGTSATITAFSITSNVATFQATNTFAAGQQVTISGLSTGTYLNGITLTVLPTGLSSTQFEANFTNANVSQTADSGTAVPVQGTQMPIFLLPGQ